MSELVFEETVVTSAPRAATKDNPYLPAVQRLPLVDPAAVERPGLAFTLPLTGETKLIGAATNPDGTPVPDSDRKAEDVAVIEAKRNLDAAGLSVGVTVRKQISYLSLKADGSENTRKDAKPTHARFKIYATAKQKRSKKNAAAETVSE